MGKLGIREVPSRAFIARQLVIDRSQRIIGYELLYRHSAAADQAEITNELEAGMAVVSILLTHMGTEWLLGDNLAFINVAPAMLTMDSMESHPICLLPPSRVVLEITGRDFSDDTLEGCRKLREQGFHIGLDDFIPSFSDKKLLESFDYIKLDVQALGTSGIKKALNTTLSGCKAQLLAKKVETAAEFHACKELGLHGFQGYHFAHPETLSVRAISPTESRIIELLNLIRNNADFSEIEAAFKHDIALSVRLLRYINSVGFGLTGKVNSIQHALTLLGYRQLYRWMSLLLLSPNTRPIPPALASTALMRGRLTELLGQERLRGHERDNLFVTGLFSLIDIILEIPMDRALESLKLPDRITEAIVSRTGIYGRFLKLAEACETGEWDEIEALAKELNLPPEQVNEAQLQAMAWAEEIPL